MVRTILQVEWAYRHPCTLARVRRHSTPPRRLEGASDQSAITNLVTGFT
jgi:hypothetical protein